MKLGRAGERVVRKNDVQRRFVDLVQEVLRFRADDIQQRLQRDLVFPRRPCRIGCSERFGEELERAFPVKYRVGAGVKRFLNRSRPEFDIFRLAYALCSPPLAALPGTFEDLLTEDGPISPSRNRG